MDHEKLTVPFICHADLSRFIHIVSDIQVMIPQECSEFLQSYFSLIRKNFGSTVGGLKCDSMFVTMESLVRVAMAHARICLRDEVLLDDALVSIMLVEESLLFVTGLSVLGFASLPEDQESIWSLCGDSQSGGGGVKKEEGEGMSNPWVSTNDPDNAILRLHEHIVRIFESSLI
ncbi:hypothetical protein BDR26DRAFT_858230 [Obelidium mucronatum]|nr:hypothetical protein BDR26DRAFT_858230 [Obelidium mucronatum]